MIFRGKHRKTRTILRVPSPIHQRWSYNRSMRFFFRPGGLVVLFMTTTLTMASCSRDPRAAIAGKWTSAQTGDYEFFPDGTFTDYSRQWKTNNIGKFSFPDSQHIKLELNGMTLLGTFSVSSDSLTWTVWAGQPEVLTRTAK